LAAFQVTYPNISVTQETIAGDYPAQMITRFGARFDAIVEGATYAQPGSGLMKNYSGTGSVQDAFQSAFTREITDKTYGVASVVNATTEAITKGLSQ